MNWDEFEAETRELIAKIDVKPDIIVSIVRGGLIPATLIAKQLDIKNFLTLKVGRDTPERIVRSEIAEDILGKTVLLVEDMIETGRSLIVGKKYLESKGAIVMTACLYIMPQSEIKPDYFLRSVNEVASFPWNK